MTTNKESTFEICQHDRENPYVMISRTMAQDKSISPKAKGVLLYLLSLPKDWKIYHSQLQNGLGVGEDYINSAMDELIANGYADRTRDRVKGIFQPYKYKIREFKKLNPDGKNQPGLASPVNPALQKRERESTQKETTTTVAVVSSEKKPYRTAMTKLYECLISIDIPEKEKRWLVHRYDEQIVQEAIAWATSPQTVITKGLTQAIKWACKERPEMPKNPEDEFEHNRLLAEIQDGRENDFALIVALTKHVEFVYGIHVHCIGYDSKNFEELLKAALIKYKFEE